MSSYAPVQTPYLREFLKFQIHLLLKWLPLERIFKNHRCLVSRLSFFLSSGVVCGRFFVLSVVVSQCVSACLLLWLRLCQLSCLCVYVCVSLTHTHSLSRARARALSLSVANWLHGVTLPRPNHWVRYDSFKCATWLIQMCDMTHSHEDMTHSYTGAVMSWQNFREIHSSFLGTQLLVWASGGWQLLVWASGRWLVIFSIHFSKSAIFVVFKCAKKAIPSWVRLNIKSMLFLRNSGIHKISFISGLFKVDEPFWELAEDSLND